MIFTPDVNTVARPHESFVDCWRDWMLVDDLDGGVDRMRWRALHSREQWLPQENLEERRQYEARVNRSDLYPGLSQGLDDAIARPFAKPVQVQDIPAELEALLPDIDGDGSDLTQFLAHFMRSACKHGLAHAWVDYTKTVPSNGKTVTLADVKAQSPRPWWKIIEAPRLLNWESFTLPSGKRALRTAWIHEVENGKEYIRILRLNSQERWQNKAYMPPKHSDGEDLEARFYQYAHGRDQNWEPVEDPAPYGPQGGFKDGLPIVTVYTGYMGFMRAKPPFKALAETNLTHWQSSSDQRNIVHVARVPILFARGMASEELKGAAVGAGSVIFSKNPTADLRYTEHSGAAVAVGQDDLDRLERRMEQLGVRPHVERMQGATATGVAINADGADTDVQAWAQAVDTAAEQCFKLSAVWMGEPDLAASIDVQIFKDYQVAYKGASDLSTLQSDVKDGRIQHLTYLREIQRRGVLGDDVDIEEEAKSSAPVVDAADETVDDGATGNADAPDGNTADAQVAGGEEVVADLALNGAQVTALQGVVQAVSDGNMPAEAAKVLILKAFPTFTDAEVAKMIGSAESHEPPPTPAPGDPDAEGDNETDDPDATPGESQPGDPEE